MNAEIRENLQLKRTWIELECEMGSIQMLNSQVTTEWYKIQRFAVWQTEYRIAVHLFIEIERMKQRNWMIEESHKNENLCISSMVWAEIMVYCVSFTCGYGCIFLFLFIFFCPCTTITRTPNCCNLFKFSTITFGIYFIMAVLSILIIIGLTEPH